jgi:phenylpropionate dioxygenase-like ring-hydroxylating dioxygenase large terminal subunit
MHGVPSLDSSTIDAPVDAIADASDEVFSEASVEARPDAPVRDLRRVPIHPDYWYPLAWSHEVKRGKAHGVTFAGEPIVLVRTESGVTFALEDRCAHRQVPLHGAWSRAKYPLLLSGWTYDCSGRCVDIPYLGRERLPNACARTRAARNRG